MLPSLIAILILAAAWFAAIRYGADSRDGQDWRPQPAGAVLRDRRPRRRAHSLRGDLATAARVVRRAGARFVEFNRAQVDLWERYLLAQRPEQAQRLRWVRTRNGWRLDGRIALDLRAQPPRRPGSTLPPGPRAAGR